MALINTPTQLTPAQQTAAQIRQLVGNLFAQMGSTYSATYRAFWTDPVNVSAALGTDAADLFRLASILVTAINSAKEGTIPTSQQGAPAGYTATPAADGSVTITVPAPAPSPAPAPAPTPSPTPAPTPGA